MTSSLSSTLEQSLAYYQRQAQAYFDATAQLQMAPVRERFIRYLDQGAAILDAGCGSGRDAKAFAEAGFRVAAFDACPELVRLAQAFTGLPVDCQTFEECQAVEQYAGVWACSSLVHLDDTQLAGALANLSRALRQGGCIYLNFKVGETPFVDTDGRFFNPATPAKAAKLCEQSGLWVAEMWTTSSLRQPDVQWLNVLALKRSAGAVR